MKTKQYIVPKTEITALQQSVTICNNVSLNTSSTEGNSWIEAY